MKRLIRLTESDLHRIVKESVKRALNEQSCVETYYHGGDLKDDLFYSGVMWLTPQDYYAKEYSKDRNNPTIWEIKIDESKIKAASIYGIEEIVGAGFDPYDPTKEEVQLVINEGYNAYYMDYDSYNAEGLCIFTKEPVVSIRQLTQKEYNMIEDSDD